MSDDLKPLRFFALLLSCYHPATFGHAVQSPKD